MELRKLQIKGMLYKKRFLSFLLWLAEIAIALLLAAAFSVFLCKSTLIQENSMAPVFEAGDELLINTAAYKFSEPQRGDIIAFRTGKDKNTGVHVKRIIGMPGETVMIKDGVVYINGEAYKEELPAIENPGTAKTPQTIGKNQYFVLGDSRNRSEDSRYTTIGMVGKDNIVGKIWFRSGPIKRIGFIK